jgi:tRNA A-37 threonylcarbamoyl transferase component Bud32
MCAVQEARTLNRCRRVGVDAPVVRFVDLCRSRILMERVQGITAKAYLQAPRVQTERHALAAAIGSGIAQLHSNNIIHGDLTTSNIMIRAAADADADAAAAHAGDAGHSVSAAAVAAWPRPREVCFIDFGLSSFSAAPEDKAVDLYVLQRAVYSAHTDLGRLAMLAPGGEGAAASDGPCDMQVEASVQGASTLGGTDISDAVAVEAAAASVDAAAASTGDEDGEDDGPLDSDEPEDAVCIDFFNAILAAYFGAVRDAAVIKGRYEQVRLRGRKRVAFG